MPASTYVQIKALETDACDTSLCIHEVRTVRARIHEAAVASMNAKRELEYTEWRNMDGRAIYQLLSRLSDGTAHSMYPHFARYKSVSAHVLGAKKEYKTKKRKRHELEIAKHQATASSSPSSLSTFDCTVLSLTKQDKEREMETIKIDAPNGRKALVIKKHKLHSKLVTLADVAENGTSVITSAARLNCNNRRKYKPAASFMDRLLLRREEISDVGNMHITNVVCKCIIRGKLDVDILSALMYGKVQTFPHCVIKVENIYTDTISLYKSGQVHIAGRADLLVHLYSLSLVLQHYVEYTGEYVDVTDFAGVNFIGTFFAGGNIDLARRRDEYRRSGLRAAYNAENFTGLHVYFGIHDDLVAVLHSSGMINIVGMKDEFDVDDIRRDIVPSLLADGDEVQE